MKLQGSGEHDSGCVIVGPNMIEVMDNKVVGQCMNVTINNIPVVVMVVSFMTLNSPTVINISITFTRKKTTNTEGCVYLFITHAILCT